MKSALKYVLTTISVAVAAVLLSTILINAFVCIKSSFYFKTADEADDMRYDYILVLGCGLNGDGTPGGMLSDRMEKAIAIYKKYGGKLLLSGDNTSPYYDEPGAMRRMAIERGVPTDDVITDPNGTSTLESIYNAKSVFGAERLIIATQNYHLYRAVYAARAIGIDAYGVIADGDGYRTETSQLFREVLARIKDFFSAFRYAGK